ncbi:MAG: FtsX-like permease family protein [Candidatus Heimdallarchaeota archaeon]|nr:FtsX-like permease family protein [Candidatus Heimdallarchaeota archaeon]
MADLRGKMEWLPFTIQSIFRNKRRSFAMLSGIALGITIISGIYIYSSVLKTQNFQTVVENASFEVKFDILENESLENLHKLADIVELDDRVIDTTPIGSTGFDEVEVSVIVDKLGDGSAVDSQNPGSSDFLNMAPVFVENDYPETEIGKKFLSSSELEGVFDVSDNNVVISRAIASKFQLEVDDNIYSINMSYAFRERGGALKFYEGYVSNVTVSGIYEFRSGDAGIFGSFFNPEELYFSFDALNTDLPELKRWFDEELGRFLAVKIDETQFTVSDPETMNDEILKFMNYITDLAEKEGMEIVGSNNVQNLLLPFQLLSIFINIFDFLLAAPVVILSLYLLFFGIEMSLEERRREIAIKKVQGANETQIFNEIRNQTFVLFIIGWIIGYMLGIFGAWIIASSIGFMQIDLDYVGSFASYLRLDKTALFMSAIVVGGLLTIQSRKKAKEFITSEVSETIKRFEGVKMGYLRRNNLDIVMFFIGLSTVSVTILEQIYGVDLNLNFWWSLLIQGFGPFFLWIGGSLVGIRIAKFVPLKLEGLLLNVWLFKDVSKILKSTFKRRNDTDKLAFIIVLTLSIATLATAQGVTDQNHAIRIRQYEIGSDYQINFGEISDYTQNLTNIEGVENIMAIGKFAPTLIQSTVFVISGFDVHKELALMKEGKEVGIWHEDAFDDLTPLQALQKLSDNPEGVFISSFARNILDTGIGETLKIRFEVEINATSGETEVRSISDVEVLGIYDHAPGNVNHPNVISSSILINRLRAIRDNTTIADDAPMNATRYLVKSTYGDAITEDQINQMTSQFNQIPSYASAVSLQRELRELDEQPTSYGITGLLTMNFIVSVAAALISTFTYSAILMERRKHEFAVLRAIGAKKSQIYKIAIGENLIMVLTTAIWGSLIGIGITYLFNGLFGTFAFILGGGAIDRLVTFPWLYVSIIGFCTSIGVLVATAVSARGAANQDLSIATRVV